jgi:hypothetical protein
MCFKHFIFFILAIGFAANAQAGEEQASVNALKLTPDTCVSLQQGRLCYAKITIQWQSSKPVNVCLKVNQIQLECWQQSQRGQIHYEFVGSESMPVQLVSENAVLADTVIKVNWVQKNPKIKRHWRLF